MLDRNDRITMAVGLVVRVPLLRPQLLDYVWKTLGRWAPWAAWRRGIFRAAAADLLPPEIATRRKSGFPAIRDPAYDEELMPRLEDCIAEDPSSSAI